MKTTYIKIPVSERLPELGKFVPTIDEEGNIVVYRLLELPKSYSSQKPDSAWNMRDGVGTNSPPNNLAITHWLEEQPLPAIEEKSLKNILKLYEEWRENTIIPDTTTELINDFFLQNPEILSPSPAKQETSEHDIMMRIAEECCVRRDEEGHSFAEIIQYAISEIDKYRGSKPSDSPKEPEQGECEHNNTIFQNLRCNVCKDCGDILETDV